MRAKRLLALCVLAMLVGSRAWAADETQPAPQPEQAQPAPQPQQAQPAPQPEQPQPAPQPQQAQPAQKQWSDYRILVERNVFSRTRGRSVRGPFPPPPPPPPPPKPERYVIMRGVVRRDDGLVAFLEDTRSGSVIQARTGDQLLSGKVGEITLNSMRYVRDTIEAEVAIGQNLERQASAPSGPTAGAAGAPAGAGAGAPGSSGILERLRQQRQREVGQ